MSCKLSLTLLSLVRYSVSFQVPRMSFTATWWIFFCYRRENQLDEYQESNLYCVPRVLLPFSFPNIGKPSMSKGVTIFLPNFASQIPHSGGIPLLQRDCV